VANVRGGEQWSQQRMCVPEDNRKHETCSRQLNYMTPGYNIYNQETIIIIIIIIIIITTAVLPATPGGDTN
jgi:hypothetical protein